MHVQLEYVPKEGFKIQDFGEGRGGKVDKWIVSFEFCLSFNNV